MKTPTRICNALVCASMLAAGGSALAQKAPLPPAADAPPSPSAVTPPPLMPAPPPGPKDPADPGNVDAAAFLSKISRDASALPNGGQLQMSYATVVDKILPSVVTIYSSTPIKTPQVDEIPPQLRPFFYRFFGNPGGGGGFGEDDEEEQAPNPRRRGQPRQQPLPQEEDDEENQQKGVGSGVIITQDGYILTNNHVIAEAKKIEVAVDIDGTTRSYTAEVIGADPPTDVALIKINATGLKPATLGNSAGLRVGDVVLAAGAPMELSRSVTQGIVSALGRSNGGIVGRGRMQGYEDFIQTDASINPGNSGGPLVDAMGRVVGISTAILSRTGMNAGIGFAIPINMAMGIVEDLLDDGEVQRGFLGVNIVDLSPALAERLDFKDHGGAVVMRVGADSPAEKAGLQLEDIIVSINNQKVTDSSRLRLIVSGTRPGTSVPMEVVRNGKRMTVTATLETMPEEALSEMGSGGNRNLPRKGGSQSKDTTSELVAGVIVQNLSKALRERHDVPNNVNGVLVTSINADSRAAASGLEEGDVISHINRKPVTGAPEARTLARESGKNVLLRIWRKGDTMLLMIAN